MEAFGFSLEIGALIAGLTMASLPYRFEIESKMRPLRDFFIVLFFVFLGSQLQLNELVSYIIPIIVFSLFVLIGKPLIVIGIMNRL
jgi:Kef-type K+ transport system membrane component KefB